MGWFGRKQDDRHDEPAPTLVVLAQRALAERGMETTVEVPAGEQARLVGTDGRVFLLENLAAQVHGETPDVQADMVAEHFDRMIQAYSEPAPEELGADELRQRIRLRILPDPSADGGTGLGAGPSDPTDLDYARPFAPGLVLGLCVDYPTMVSTLSGPTLPRLALGIDELFAFGQLGTDDEPVDEHAEIAPGVFIVEGESLFVASKAVNLPALFGAAGFGTVFAIPHRHLLLAVPIRDASSITSVQMLAGLVVQVLTDGEHGLPGGVLSPLLYFSRNGRVSAVSGFDDETGAMRIEVDERFQEALEQAAAAS
ncbi:hypothetical protein ACIPEP_11020 [Curtobacterium sp. NPDC087082]|uniref:hypothetical protein n=1 Tax=Curtobacterium sp. NPDC087082 TaxID=3363966 RepID=UPI0038092A1B